MSNLKVISHLEETLVGRYDGTDYEFAPEEPTVLSLEAATFIFQLDSEDKSRALNALGLLIPGKHQYADAIKQLEKISFIEGKFRFEDEDEDSEPDDPNAEEGAGATRARAGKKTGGRRPQVHPSGGAAAGQPAAAEPPAAA